MTLDIKIERRIFMGEMVNLTPEKDFNNPWSQPYHFTYIDEYDNQVPAVAYFRFVQ